MVAGRPGGARLAGLREPVAERATCIAGLAMEAQSDDGDAQDAARPERVEGAWFLDGETRMDDQQHALAGLLRTIPIVEASEREPDGGDDTPSGWLWAAVLLLALNPARAAFAVPRAGRSPRDVLGVAAAGGAIGGLAVCSAAAVGGRCSRRSTSVSPRSEPRPGSWRRWPAQSTCSVGRPRPSPRCRAGAPHSSR